MEFVVGDHVFLKGFPYKGRMQFGKKINLSLRYVGLFEIEGHVSPVVYYLALTSKYVTLHDVFHISMLKKYHHDHSHIILRLMVPICVDMAYEECLRRSLIK